MFATIWATISKWVIGLGAILAAIGGAILYGRAKGKGEAETKQAVAHGEAIEKAAETRNEVEQDVQSLPAPAEGKPVPVRDAPPDSAAGVLRDDGWTR